MGAEQSPATSPPSASNSTASVLLKHSVGALKGEKVKPRVEVRVSLDFLGEGVGLPENYVTEPHQRIEIYRKLAQANEKSLLDALQKELRDRFGPLPPPVELLLAVGELKILASEKNVTTIEVEEDKLKLVRAGDFHHPRRQIPPSHQEKDPKARLKEIKRLLLAL